MPSKKLFDECDPNKIKLSYPRCSFQIAGEKQKHDTVKSPYATFPLLRPIAPYRRRWEHLDASSRLNDAF